MNQTTVTGPGETPEDGEMNQTTLTGPGETPDDGEIKSDDSDWTRRDS